MEINNINSFFDKFKKIIYQKEENQKIIKSIISENISYEIGDDFFEYKKGIVNLKCSFLIKNEILMRKERILKEINNNISKDSNVVDIK